MPLLETTSDASATTSSVVIEPSPVMSPADVMHGDSTMPLMTAFCSTVRSATFTLPSLLTSPEPSAAHASAWTAEQISSA